MPGSHIDLVSGGIADGRDPCAPVCPGWPPGNHCHWPQLSDRYGLFDENLNTTDTKEHKGTCFFSNERWKVYGIGFSLCFSWSLDLSRNNLPVLSRKTGQIPGNVFFIAKCPVFNHESMNLFTGNDLITSGRQTDSFWEEVFLYLNCKKISSRRTQRKWKYCAKSAKETFGLKHFLFFLAYFA